MRDKGPALAQAAAAAQPSADLRALPMSELIKVGAPFIGLALIKAGMLRFGPAFWLRIPIGGLEPAHDSVRPCEICGIKRGLAAGATTDEVRGPAWHNYALPSKSSLVNRCQPRPGKGS